MYVCVCVGRKITKEVTALKVYGTSYFATKLSKLLQFFQFMSFLAHGWRHFSLHISQCYSFRIENLCNCQNNGKNIRTR